MKNIALSLLLLFTLLPAFAQKAAIDQADVDRIVRTLASDDMQGRKSFEPGSEKAAEFITKEFNRIGLKPLAGLADFRQTFHVNRVKPSKAEVTINGQSIGADEILVMSDQPQLQWKSENSEAPQVVLIRAEGKFAQKASELVKAHQNSLVLVDPAHRDIFTKYRNYFGQENVSLEQEKAGSLVFVLHQPATSPTFTIQAVNQIEKLSLSNIAGMIPGKSEKEEIVLFSAHYDHIGILKPVNGDSIANGADDDASGTTAVIALADYYKKLKNNERTLVFVAFTAEETGGYGSQYFSRQMDPAKVVAMFNIEMIGKPSKFGKNTAWITGYEKSDLGKILQNNLQGSQFTFHPDPYPEQNLFYRSDNATLARLGVPAHSISTDGIDIDKLYHSVDDEYKTLDIANMTQVIRAIAQSARSIVSGKDTPTRVDTAELK